MRLGVAWYPEQWPRGRWDEDLRLMQQAGLNVVRLGEFAWSQMEPCEGRYELDWLVDLCDRCQAAGLEVVMGTPTAAPPAWLTRAHPEVLPQDAEGRIRSHGGRCHYRVASPVYRRYCVAIASAMAQRLGRHPAVIGWQIDNEFWATSHDPETVAAFRRWLQNRYGTLEQLNAAWGTAFWSQQYRDWEELHHPNGGGNPSLLLAWQRFHSQMYVEFQHDQIQALRPHLGPEVWVTHNFHPHDDLDRLPIAAEHDLLAWDAYIHYGDQLDPARNALEMARIRGLKPGRPLWIMETQPGFVNWRPVCLHQPPGHTNAFAWHLIGHGADAVLYWQWRPAPGGQEQYHGCLLRQDGTPRPVYDEIRRFGQQLARLSPWLDGSRVQPRVAVIDRWADRYALRLQRHHKDYDPTRHTQVTVAAIKAHGEAFDVIEDVTGLSRYAVVFAPRLHAVSEVDLQNLLAYVEQGGHLVLGARSCVKDPDNRLREERQPGNLLAARLGGKVRDFYALAEPVTTRGNLGERKAHWFGESWDGQPAEDEVWQRWYDPNGWLDGLPAVVSRAVGRGRLTWCGAIFDILGEKSLVWNVLSAAGIHPRISMPAGVEMCTRVQGSRKVHLFINHGTASTTVDLPAGWYDPISRAAMIRFELPGREARLLLEDKP